VTAQVLAAALDTSAAVGKDAGLRAAWQDRLDHLAAFPTAMVPDPADNTSQVEVFTAQEHPRYCPGLPGALAALAFSVVNPLSMAHLYGRAARRALNGLFRRFPPPSPPPLWGAVPGSTNPLNVYALWPGETVGASSPAALRSVGARTVCRLLTVPILTAL
jgi:hypothetical protein